MKELTSYKRNSWKRILAAVLMLAMVVLAGAAAAEDDSTTDTILTVTADGGVATVKTMEELEQAFENTNVKSIVVEPSQDFNFTGKTFTKPVTFSKRSDSVHHGIYGNVTIASGVTVTIDSSCNCEFKADTKKLSLNISTGAFLDIDNNNNICNIKDLIKNNTVNNGTIRFGSNCDANVMQEMLVNGPDGKYVAKEDISDDSGVIVSKDVSILKSNHSITIEIPNNDSEFTLIDNGSMPFGNKVDTYRILGAGKFIIQQGTESTLTINSKVYISPDFVIKATGTYTIDLDIVGQLIVYGDMTINGNVFLSKLNGNSCFGYGGYLPDIFTNEEDGDESWTPYYLEFDFNDASSYIRPGTKNFILESGVKYILPEVTKGTFDTATASSSTLTLSGNDTFAFTINKETGASSTSNPVWYLYGEKMISSITYPIDPNSDGTTFTIRYTSEKKKVFWYQQDITEQLTRGYIYKTSDGKYSFMVPEYGTLVLNRVDHPANTYYHYLGSTNDGYDQTVVVSAPELSFSSISEKTLYRTGDEKKETVVQIMNDLGLPMDLAFVKEGLSTFQSKIPGTSVSGGDGRFTITTSEDSELGTWKVYAHFTTLSSEAGDYAYVKVGEITIYQSKDPESAEVTSMIPETVDDSGVVEITLEGTGNRKVWVTYYDADTETADDAVKMTTTSDKLKFVENQANLSTDGTYFVIPDSKEVKIAIKADTGVFSQKKYMIVIKVEGCRVDLPGGEKNPIVKELTVNGNGFTAKLERDTYTLGENLKVTGTYTDTSGSFGLSFYIEGTNIPMTKLNVPATVLGNVQGSDIRNGEYYYYLGSSYTGLQYSYNMATWNPGIYKIYASLITNFTDGKNDFTVKDKANILAKATTLTVTLEESAIKIVEMPEDVEVGFDSNGNSRYMTVVVEAKSADAISFYIVGQNKMFYINGEDALKEGYIKTLNSGEDSYLYAGDGSSNKYWYSDGDGNTPATDKSLKKILNYLGRNDVPIDGGAKEYPPLLIINNEDGTFTVYVHLAGTDGNESSIANTGDNQLADGQYYVVVQNPMADKIFNTKAETAANHGYSSGVDVITNNTFKFNVPALENILAAQSLIDAIKEGGDQCAGKDFYVVATPEGDLVWTEPKASYGQGEIITMGVTGYKSENALLATMELNQFDFTQDNINLIQSFIPEKSGSSAPYTWKFSLDTSGTPTGTYAIIVKDAENKVIKTFATKIVEGTAKPGDSGKTTTVDSMVITGPDQVKEGSMCSYTIDMTNRLNGDLEWKVSDDILASIDKYGNFTAKSQGHVTVTVSDIKTGENGSKTVTIVKNDGGTTTDTQKSAKSPFPVLGILAGIGIAGVFVMRRKNT